MKKDKGIALYLSVVILAIILAVVFGLMAILITQIKTIRGMGNSVVALYAADAGVEEALFYFYNNNLSELSGDIRENFTSGASYEVEVVCCDSSESSCSWGKGDPPENCPDDFDQKEDCQATRYCIRSVGNYEKTKRAIEAKLFPIEE